MSERRLFRWVLTATVGAALCTSAGATVCVDGFYGNDLLTGDCTLAANGRWSAPVRTLARAFELAPASSDIWVAVGTYAQDGLVVPADVTLVGGFRGTESLVSQADPATWAVVVRPASPAQTNTAALSISPGATVVGIRATSGDGQAGAALALTCPAAGTATYDVRQSELYGSRIGLWAPPCELGEQALASSNNRYHDNAKGFARDPLDPIMDDDGFGVTFQDDAFFRNGLIGIEVAKYGAPFSSGIRYALSEVLLLDNGAGVQGGDVEDRGTVVDVRNSLIARSTGSGFKIVGWDVGPSHIEGSTLLRNGLDGISMSSDAGGDLTVIRSTIKSQGRHGIQRSVSSLDGSLTASGSRILDNAGDGVSISNSWYAASASLASNVIRGNSRAVDYSSFVRYTSSVGGTVETRNDLSGNRLACIANSIPGHAVLAENNYFGFNTASEIAACMVGLVDYEPWFWPASGEYLDGTPRQVLSWPTFSTYPSRPSLPHDRPARTSRIAVTTNLDTWSSGSRLGSFGGHLRWDPRVLRFSRWVSKAPTFDVFCNETEVDAGYLRCTGTNVDGVEGITTPICVEFDVEGPVRWPSAVDVEPSSLYSDAQSNPPFEDLTSILVPEDSYITVAPTALFGDVLANGRVDSGDALVLLSREVGLTIPAESSQRIEEHLGDANGDGSTNSTDANVILSHEIRLPVPEPCGRTNVVFASCADALTASDAASAPAAPSLPPPVTAWLVLDRGLIAPGETFDVQVWLSSPQGADLGSYTAELRWPEGNYDVVEVREGGKAKLSRPKFNKTLSSSGRLPFSAADPRGEPLGALRLLVVTLGARGSEARPATDLRLAFSAMAGISPSFQDLVPGMRVGKPVILRGPQEP